MTNTFRYVYVYLLISSQCCFKYISLLPSPMTLFSPKKQILTIFMAKEIEYK